MIMVPLYAISSLISLFSLGAAFVIDAIRDIYEVGRLLMIRRTCQGNVLMLFFLGFCNLLFLRPSPFISRRRTFSTHSTPRSTTKTTCIPYQSFQTRNRSKRPIYIPVLKTGHPSYVAHLHCYFLENDLIITYNRICSSQASFSSSHTYSQI